MNDSINNSIGDRGEISVGHGGRMEAAEGWMDKLIDRAFLWAIGDVAGSKKKGEFIHSEQFYVKMRTDKMLLMMATTGRNNVHSTAGSIKLVELNISRSYIGL